MTIKRPKIIDGKIFSHQYVTQNKYTVLHSSVRSQLGVEIGDWIGIYALGDGRVVLRKVSPIDVSENLKILKDIE